MSSLDAEEYLTGKKKIFAEAKRRFEYVQEREGITRNWFIDDIKFANADRNNGYQWPSSLRRQRDIDDRPCLTINKTQQHNLQIINDAKQNTPSMKVNPVGDGASYESAQVFAGLFRHIEYISNAQVAYDTATTFQVQGGIGYWRVVTDYAGDDTFDQEIFIRRVKDPLSIYLDPDINEVDGSDAEYAFVFVDMTREEFNAAYPKYKDKAGQSALGNDEYWISDDHVRIAEYFRKVPREDRLLAFTNPYTGEQVIERASKIPKELLDAVIDNPDTQQRTVVDDKVEWFLIIAGEIAEEREWAGRYIPIVRVIGTETIIDGIIDRKGHTRALKDPQCMYNYHASAAVENLALQNKIPYITPVAAVDGQETYWATANTENYAYLPYNHLDDNGNPIPPPVRATPPVQSTGYLQAMQTAQQEMMMVSGQYEANFGQKSNEKSGVAINERQRQGDTATYHFIDNLAIGIRFTGRILLDLIPKIYDTPRVIRILAEDGEESHVQLDPNAQAAYAEYQQRQRDVVMKIFNPNVGKYEVMADVGPGYATKRQEAWNAYTQIISQNPEMVNIAGDLMFKNGDFPGSDEIAKRLERMVPPQAKGDNVPNPEVQQLQIQVQKAQEINSKLLQSLAEERLKSYGIAAQKNIDIYKAETDRMKAESDVLAKHVVTPQLEAEMMHDMNMQIQNTSLQQASAFITQNSMNQQVNNGASA